MVLVKDFIKIPTGTKKVLVMNRNTSRWIVRHNGRVYNASSFVLSDGAFNFGQELVTYGEVTVYR